jgi:hypothetical protein
MIARPDLLIARPNLGAAATIEWVGISIAKFAAWIYLPGRGFRISADERGKAATSLATDIVRNN